MQIIKTRPDYDIVKRNLTNRRATFAIEKNANTATIVCNNKKTAIYRATIEKNQKYFRKAGIGAVIRTVHSQVRKFGRESLMAGELIKPVSPDYSASYRDAKGFKYLPMGAELCIIDIKHAYWIVAYNMGLISKKTYDLYADNPEYKLARNIALSTLTSKKEREYFVKGIHKYTIVCDNGLQKLIYANIRQTTYNLIGDLSEMLGSACYGYRVDGLVALYDFEVVKESKEYFKKHNVKFEITRYIKVSDTHMKNSNSGELKKF